MQFDKLADGTILVYFLLHDKSSYILGTLVQWPCGDWVFRPHKTELWHKDMMVIAEKMAELEAERE